MNLKLIKLQSLLIGLFTLILALNGLRVHAEQELQENCNIARTTVMPPPNCRPFPFCAALANIMNYGAAFIS